MQRKQMLLISKLKNKHFKCISLMNRCFSLEERNTVESSLITIISKPNYLKSLGLKRKTLGELKIRDKRVSICLSMWLGIFNILQYSYSPIFRTPFSSSFFYWLFYYFFSTLFRFLFYFIFLSTALAFLFFSLLCFYLA